MRRPSNLDPPLSLKQRVADLREQLQDLAEKLKGSIARVVGQAVADFIEALVRRLLRYRMELPWSHSRGHRHRDHRDPWQEQEDPWREGEEESSWSEDEESLWLPPARLEDRDGTSHLTASGVLGGFSKLLQQLERHGPRALLVATGLGLALFGGLSSLGGLPFLASALALAG